jgi:hypothetical protein
MSEFPLGTFDLADRMKDMHVKAAHREARGRRLQKQAAAGQPSGQRFYSAILAGLGQHLAAWGETLEERYSSEESRPTPASAN